MIETRKKNKQIDWEFLNLCYQDEHREFQYLVGDYLQTMKAFLKYEDIAYIQKYVQTKQWWDSVDFLDRIIGDIGLHDQRVNELMLDWSKSNDIWMRRIAIDHQLCRKDKTNIQLLEKILVNNLGSDEFFINKAIGWALRDYSKINPQWVQSFIERHQDQMSSLSIKEGSKYI
ncbi:DNA alkylation repair protein [Allocoprobacillus halotolerans]|uniref:DNA alkylation repair protein n=1 Tax=Allocoprobacillus halotolerans TaxID=2944914 RepID=UPI00338D54AA